MIDVKIAQNNLDCGKLFKLLFFFHNYCDQETLAFHYELSFPVAILHVGGAKKSIASIILEKNNPFVHSVDIISHELGTHFVNVKIRCLNQPLLSTEKKISLIVTSSNKAYKDGVSEYFRRPLSQDKPSGSVLSELLNLIGNSFNLAEIRTLCLELMVDYEDILGDTKTDKVRELILYFYRFNRLPDLVQYCRKKRPNLMWPHT